MLRCLRHILYLEVPILIVMQLLGDHCMGCALILEYSFTIASICSGWSAYSVNFLNTFGIHLYSLLTSAPIIFASTNNKIIFVNGLVNLPAVFILVIISVLLIRGIKQSNLVNTIIIVLKVAIVFIFTYFGLSHILVIMCLIFHLIQVFSGNLMIRNI